MVISELIKELKDAQAIHGDLPVEARFAMGEVVHFLSAEKLDVVCVERSHTGLTIAVRREAPDNE